MRFAWLLAAALLIASPASAQRMMVLGAGGPFTAAAGYTGPGDVVSSATAWYGLRGYSAAYAATGTGKSVNVRRASDNATQDIVILTTGAFDIASYNTFVGSDATASCTLAGTSAACTGASATIHVNDPVTGTGITNPCVVTATNGSTTATVSIAGTSTSCGTVAVAATFTFQVAGLLSKIYDQSGANACTSAPCDLAQATAGSQPQLLPDGGNGLPSVFFNGAQSLSGTFPSGKAQPYTFSMVAGTTASSSSNMSFMGTGGGANPNVHHFTAGNTWQQQATSSYQFTSNDAVVHAANIVFNAASSVANIDGTQTTGTVGAAANVGTTLFLGIVTGGTWFLLGKMDEGGIWPVGFTTPQQSSMQTNQKAYWGTP